MGLTQFRRQEVLAALHVGLKRSQLFALYREFGRPIFERETRIPTNSDQARRMPADCFSKAWTPRPLERCPFLLAPRGSVLSLVSLLFRKLCIFALEQF